MKIVPKKGYLLIKPATVENMTSGGIIVTPKETTTPSIGTIVEIGAGSQYKVGEKVIVVLGATALERTVDIEGTKHLLLNEESVLGYVFE